MKFNYKRHRLNSLRNGFLTDDKLYNNPFVILVCGSQDENVEKIYQYQNYSQKYNIIIQPFNINNSESGDDYEIYHYYENVLKINFIVCEKIYNDHVFFKDFGVCEENFTNYVFDHKLIFNKKSIGPEGLHE